MSRASLAIDEGIKDHLAQDPPLRALKLTQDPKRPRWAIHESIPLGPSLKEDFQKVITLLKESEPCAVLVRLKDTLETLPAAELDWIVVAWCPESLPEPAQQRHLVSTFSLREKLLHLRLTELRVGTWLEVSWEAFLEKAKDVISGEPQAVSPNRKRNSVMQRLKEYEGALPAAQREAFRVDVSNLMPTATTAVSKLNMVDATQQWSTVVSLLERYTGTALAMFHPWVIITNFPGYIDAFSTKCHAPVVTGSCWKCAHSESESVSIINYHSGSPNAALIIDILGRIDKFELVLFVGMVGPLQCSDFCQPLRAGETFVPVGAVRAEGVSDHYLPVGTPAVPDPQLLQAIMQAAESGSLDSQGVQNGVVYTMNIRFWEYDEKLKAHIRESTADAIDMETATIFAAARRLGIKAAAMHLVSDTPFEAPKDTALAKRCFEELAPAHIVKAVAALKSVGDFIRASDSAEVQRYLKSRGLKAGPS